MAMVKGFWSYVHADDTAESGRISQLARDVVAQYELLTGDAIELFLDKDDLGWGDEWKSKLDNSLATVAFFIPVVTPRYFQSVECRRELQFFARRATDLGVKELVMPLLYADVAEFSDDSPSDSLVELVRSFQWEDWRDLRFAERTSQDYRVAVARMATRLVEANRTAERTDVVAAATALETLESDASEDPGFMDRLAEAETAMPLWSDTLVAIGQEIESIGQMMQEATNEIKESDKRGGAFAARLTVARQLAQRLRPRAVNILDFGTQFTNQLHSVDGGIRVMIERVPSAVTDPDDEFSLQDGCRFFETIRFLAKQADLGLGALQGMVDAIRPIESMSRDLRPPLRDLRKGLTVMIEGQEVIKDWVSLIEGSSLDCDGVDVDLSAIAAVEGDSPLTGEQCGEDLDD